VEPKEILALFGRPIVLLKILRKEKKPCDSAWQKLTVADMTADYLASLNGRTNIGILHGESSGGLCGIEFDSGEYAKLFSAANPWTVSGLWSKAKRGPCFWVFIRGAFPKSHDLFDAEGRHIGEFRSTGRQTVFSGEHPSGLEYRNSGRPPAELEYSQIVFPHGILTARPRPEPAPALARRDRDQVIRDIAQESATSLFTIFNGQLFLNERFVAELIERLYDILFEQDEATFREYDPATGAWQYEHPDYVRKKIGDELRDLSICLAEPRLFKKIRSATINPIFNQLQAIVGKRGFFDKPHGMLHAKNGMFDIGINEIRRFDFSPAWRSRGFVDINYKQEAACPKFLAAINYALEPEDVSLVQKWAGNLLIAGNPSHRLMLFIGKAGRGKSFLAEVFETIIGLENVAGLRPKLLNERFELSAFPGKMLLVGKDRDQDFLNHQGAAVIKSLVGADTSLMAESKHANRRFYIKGKFNVLITMNEPPRLRTGGMEDAAAWLRRILSVEFTSPPIEKVQHDYALEIVKEEAEGVLAWMVAGRIALLRDIAETGNYVLTPEQQARVDVIVAESQSALHFAKACVYRKDGASVTSAELVRAYAQYCKAREWTPMPERVFLERISEIVLKLYMAGKSNDIKGTDGKLKRGYRGIAIASEDNDA
jgi:phage/plasmid-associated DNA primase